MIKNYFKYILSKTFNLTLLQMALWKFTKGVMKHESVFSLSTLKWPFKYTVTDILRTNNHCY